MKGMQKIGVKINTNIVRSRSGRILKLVAKNVKKRLKFCLAYNDLLTFDAPLKLLHTTLFYFYKLDLLSVKNG